MQIRELIDLSVNKTRRTVLLGLAAIGLVAISGAGSAEAGELVNALPDEVAMDGFDVVAYHTDGAPRKGEAAHRVDYKGKTWLFSSAENARKFSDEPTRYEPQYNGWCSYAVSEGYGAEVDFVNGWVVIDGKLYLNWNEEVRDEFVAEQDKRIQQSRSNWNTVHSGMQDGSVALYRHADEDAGISHPQQLN